MVLAGVREVTPSAKTRVAVCEGAGERVLEITVFPGNGLATVSTVGSEPEFVGTVTALNVREGWFNPKLGVAAEFSKADREAICKAADAAYQRARAALLQAAPADPAAPPIRPPREGLTSFVIVDGLRVAFTPDVAARAVSLHTGIGTPRLIGQAWNVGESAADDRDAVVWFGSDYWEMRFGTDAVSLEIAEAAGHLWRAARDARTGVRHG